MAVLVFLLLLAAIPARAGEAIAGPVAARVVAVIDGDTIEAEAALWPGLSQRTRVRLEGIDAPELSGKCPAEKEAARRAKARLTQLIGKQILLRGIRFGKFGGRVVARVLTAGGEDVAGRMMNEGLARPYGGGRRKGWC